MAAQNIVVLTQQNFEKEVLQASTPVLVDFWGEYCPPCRALAPILDELATDYDGKLKIGKVNVQEQPELANTYQVRAVPTMIFFKQGQVAKQIVGLKSKRELQANFDSLAA
jgi:thioredoxin 1